jgi:hypothetical protein
LEQVGNMYQVNLVKNYLTNSDEIIAIAEKHRDKFSDRSLGKTYNFSTAYGDSKIKSLFHFNMNNELIDAIFKTIPDNKKTVTSFTINRYDPGDYLLRHRDSAGGYWKFKLIFLQSDKPHFQWFDENGNANLVQEEPGALLEMPIHIEHEVTKITENENPKYSLVLAWGNIGN